jgi:hypothetical protein
MQRLPKQLVATQLLTAAAATYYTAPDLTTAEIGAATATNTGGTVRTVTVHIVASGGAAAAGNKIVQTRTVPANSSVQLWEMIGQKVPPGSFISALASAATEIALTIGGYEVTNS